MPILTAYIGPSQITFLAVKSDEDQSVFHFPFVYSENLFGHFVDEPTFYRNLFNLIQRQSKMTAGSFDLAVCWHLRPPKLHMEARIGMSIEKVVAEVPEYSTTFLGSMQACSIGDKRGLSVETFIASSSCCPQMIPTEDQTRFFMDKQMIGSAIRTFVSSDHPLLFSGDRMVSKYQERYWTYLLALNAVADYGLFDVRLDLDNVLAPLTLVKFLDPSLYTKLWGKVTFRSLGTLYKTVGGVECLLETEVGTSQFFEVKNDQLFFVPLEADTRARISLKDKSKRIEKGITGGDLGFIIDTRVSENGDFFSSFGTEGIMRMTAWERQIRENLDRFAKV